MNLARIAAIVVKEWREILRDRIYFLLAFLLPIVLMIVFGYGLTQEIDNIRFAVLDHDRTSLSRHYTHRFVDSRYFDFRGHLKHEKQINSLLAGSKIELAIVIPEGFETRLIKGQRVDIQTLMDGTFPISLRTIDGYVQAINASASDELQTGYLAEHHGITAKRANVMLQPVRLNIRYLYNQELRAIWSVAPSLIMFILMLTAPLLMALSVVREKETGTIYNIYGSTISRSEYLLGKLIPHTVVSYCNGVILVCMAVYYFGTPFKGSLPFLLSALLVYVICAGCIGLLVSLLVNTQIAAIIVTVIAVFTIAMQFSGMMLPVSRMSGANYYLAHSFPPKYFNDIVSATFMKGSGLAESWPELLTLIAFVLGYFLLALSLFRKRGNS